MNSKNSYYKVIPIIVAAGSGQRMMQNKQSKQFTNPFQIPKQYLKIKNKTILEHSIDKFLEHNFSYILIVIRPQDQSLIESIIKNYQPSLQKKLIICYGGSSRSMSVYLSLQFIITNFKNISFDYILIHDAARPFISYKLIKNIIHKISGNNTTDGVLPVIKINDAVKHITQNKCTSVDRSNLYLAQTPQIFKLNVLLDCFNSQINNSNNFEIDFNDEIGLLEIYNKKIDYIEGEINNKKITFIDDLKNFHYI